MKKCIFYHRWGKWEQYVESGTAFYKWGKLAGQTSPYTETRQRRLCERCGKMEDVLVKI